ncbi:MAG: hypothetical protein R3B09_06840 [Nannocystaceae bacterium]
MASPSRPRCRRAPAPLALLLALAACTGDDAATSATESTSTSAATETGTETDTTGAAPVDLSECSAIRVCGVVSAFPGGPGNPDPTDYTDAQRCALETLAMGGPTELHYSDGCEGMCYGSLIHVRGDDSVIVSRYAEVFDGGVDLDGIQAQLETFAESDLCALKPASYFTGCLATFDASCASESHWVEACASPAPAVCEV